MNETQQFLSDALGLLNGGKNWIKGEYVIEDVDLGLCYCSYGAICQLDSDDTTDARSTAEFLLTQVAQSMGHNNIVRLNDANDTEFPLVREMFTKAIELAAGE